MSIKKHNQGSSLAQYLIVIALIALAVTGVYFIAGQNIIKSLEDFYLSLKSSPINSPGLYDKSLNPKLGNIKAGDLGGTPDYPVEKCSEGVCAIDYGQIILNGIPQDYDGFVKASGVSGGTDKLLSLLDTLVKQMEEHPEKYTPDQVAKIKGLIALGKDIVKLEKTYETQFETKLPSINKANDNISQIEATLKINYQTFKASNPGDCSNESNCKNLFLKQNDTKDLMKNLNSYNFQLKCISDTFRFYNFGDYVTSDNKQVALTGNNIIDLLTPAKTIYLNTNPDGTQTIKNNTTISDPKGTYFSYDSYFKGQSNLPANSSSQQRSIVGEFVYELKSLNDDITYDPVLKEITKTLSAEIYDLSQNVQSIAGKVNYSLFYTQYNVGNSLKQGSFGLNGSMSATYGNSLNGTLDKKPADLTRIDLKIMCNTHKGNFNNKDISCKNK